MMVKPK